MVDPISSRISIPSLDFASPIPSAGRPAEKNFGSFLESAVQSVEGTRAEAQGAVDKFLRGEEGELHSVILATQRSEMQFELLR